ASALEVEVNALRYRPSSVTIRASASCERSLAEVARVVAAGMRAHHAVTTGTGTGAHASLAVSLPADTPQVFVDALRNTEIQVVCETLEAWSLRAQRIAQATPLVFGRIRVVGVDPEETIAATYNALQGHPDVAVYTHAVTSAGRIEMLPF